jgi:hypothetical protein
MPAKRQPISQGQRSLSHGAYCDPLIHFSDRWLRMRAA